VTALCLIHLIASSRAAHLTRMHHQALLRCAISVHARA
jgi:hypothetical protein